LFWEYCTLFISHAAADEELAEYLEAFIQERDPAREIFRATHAGKIRAGEKWFKVIEEKLRWADHFLILLTESSIDRPWIWFEAGAAVGRDVKMVIAIAGDVDLADVPEPLKSYQLMRLDSPAQAKALLAEINIEVANPEVFAKAVKRIAGEAVDRTESLRYLDKIYSWRGKVEHLRDGTPGPVPEGLEHALKAAGLRLQYGIPGDLLNEHANGFSQVFLVDGRTRRALLASFGQVLLARPE
jgi:hypothetical protein